MLKRMKAVFPAVLIMWISFLGILKLFGTQYAIMGFYMTIFYMIRSNARLEVGTYIKDILMQILIMFLSITASHNAGLSFFMNLIIVFLIAYIFFSHSAPTGYMLYFIEFVFLQLRPLKWDEIPMLMVLLCFFYLIMFVLFFIKSKVKPVQSEEKSLIFQGIDLMKEYLQALLDGKVNFELTDRMEGLISNLYDSLHKSTVFPSKLKKKNISEYYMIMIMKRLLLFHKVLSTREIDAHRLFIKEKIEELDKIEKLLKERKNEEALEIAENMIEETKIGDEFLKKNFGGIVIFLTRIISEDTKLKDLIMSHVKSNYVLTKDFIKNYGWKLYYEMNEFRLAFALRLSAVTAVTMTASFFIPIQYSYWLPINAVFLVKPLYEESRTFAKQRLLGTFAGSIPLTIILSINGSTEVCFAVFFISSLFFYASPIDKWTRYMWSTLFGTSLAAISLGVGTAVELKLFYIVLASAVAMFANRFFLPKDSIGVYVNNYKNIGLISSHQLENAFRTGVDFEERKIMGMKIIYDSMQTHYIMRSMKNFIKEIKNEERKKLFTRVYSRLSDTVFSLEKMYFLFTSIDREDREEPDFKNIKALLDRFIYEVEKNPKESENTLKKISEEADSISERFKDIMVEQSALELT